MKGKVINPVTLKVGELCFWTYPTLGNGIGWAKEFLGVSDLINFDDVMPEVRFKSLKEGMDVYGFKSLKDLSNNFEENGTTLRFIFCSEDMKNSINAGMYYHKMWRDPDRVVRIYKYIKPPKKRIGKFKDFLGI